MKLKQIGLVLCVALFSISLMAAESCEKIRAAFDVGSGSTKLKVAEVNVCANQITKILLDAKEPITYSDDLAAGKPLGRSGFSETIMMQGTAAIARLKAKADALHPDEYRAVATAAFREADNAESYLKQVAQKTGLEIHIISQEKEANVGFMAAVATLRSNPLHTVSWDIGGGSMQISTEETSGFLTDLSTTASSTFKNKVLTDILHVDPLMISTPNPLSPSQIEAARKLAQTEAAKVNANIRKKITAEKGEVVGLGSVHVLNVQVRVNPLAQFYTRAELAQTVLALADKNDAALGGGAYASSALTDLILVLGYMDTLHIDKVNTRAINLTDGLLISAIPPYFLSMARGIDISTISDGTP